MPLTKTQTDAAFTLDKRGRNTFIRTCLPYAFRKLEGEGHVYLPLNRQYKPLGQRSDDHVDYAAYRAQAVVFARDPKTFKDVWSNVEGDTLWLYDDGNETRTTYFDRLGRLMAYSSKLV